LHASTLSQSPTGHALIAPGNASTMYEATKRSTYCEAAPASTQVTQTDAEWIASQLRKESDANFVPMITDIFGAYGASTFPLLQAIANAWRLRHGCTYSKAMQIIALRLSASLQRSRVYFSSIITSIRAPSPLVSKGEGGVAFTALCSPLVVEGNATSTNNPRSFSV
jgi:hypothetical protein